MGNVIFEYFENRGIEIGRKQGVELGMEKTARRMLLKGTNVFDIADITELSIERIREIHDDLRREIASFAM